MNDNKETCPCINCITHAICKNSYYMSSSLSILTLVDKCSLLDEHLVTVPSVYPATRKYDLERVTEVLLLFNWPRLINNILTSNKR